MPRYPKRPYRRPRIGRKPAKKTLAKKPSKVLTRQVKNIIHRMAENKTWTVAQANQALPAPIIGSSAVTSVQPWCINLLPNISQGVGQSGRIGNKIRLVKNRISGFVNLKPFNASTNWYQAPVLVKLFIFSCKTFSNFTGDMGFANWQQFFRVNNGDTGFTGLPLDMNYRLNDELYTLHATKSFQLNAVLSGSTSPTTPVIQGASGTFIKPFSFNLIKYAKDLKYDDQLSTRVTNRSLFMTACCMYADGTTNGYVTPYDLCEIHYNQEAQYEDL